MEYINSELYLKAKKAFPEYYDLDYWFEMITNFKEGEWFLPDNKIEEAFTICIEMHAVHLICLKKIPIWKNGSYLGDKTYLMYKLDLSYEAN